jgi:hypothetical protein
MAACETPAEERAERLAVAWAKPRAYGRAGAYLRDKYREEFDARMALELPAALAEATEDAYRYVGLPADLHSVKWTADLAQAIDEIDALIEAAAGRHEKTDSETPKEA